VSFNELVKEVARLSGCSQALARTILTMFKSRTRTAIEAGERVVLPGLGVFLPKDLPPRKLFGGTKVSEGRRSIRFRESRR
jgi:nucleoid DNA-binding protein